MFGCKQGLRRKRNTKKPNKDRHPKQKASTSKEDEIRLQALLDKNSRLHNKLAAASGLQQTTESRYIETHVSLQASRLENTQLANELKLARENFHLLQHEFELSETRYLQKKHQVKVLQNKMTEDNWEDKNLSSLMDLYKESRNELDSLERYIRQKVARKDLLMSLPMCMCPISREIVVNPVRLPCDCFCVFERAMLEQLEPSTCPTCRAEFLPEQVQPDLVLRDVIKTLVQDSVRGNTKYSLETLTRPLCTPHYTPPYTPSSTPPIHGEPAVAGGS